MKKNPMHRVGPLYIIAAIWVMWSIIFPLFKFTHFFLLAVVCLIAWAISRKAIPKTVEVTQEEKEQEQKKAEEAARLKAQQEAARAAAAAEAEAAKHRRPRTGNKAIDEMLDTEELALRELKRLDDSIEDEKLSAQIVHLEEITSKIVDFILENPKKIKEVRKFFNYYLPNAVKLLNSYDRMDETGISGTNIDGTKGKVEDMMDKLVTAFDRELDALYGDEALDISTDITVMENMLAAEGLTDDGSLKMGGQ